MCHGSTWLSSERPARGLTLKRTNTVGVLMPEFDSPFYGPILDGVHSALARSGYQMLVSCVGQNITRKATYVQLLRERKIDGALIPTPREVDVEPIRALADDRFPVVLIDGMIDAPLNRPRLKSRDSCCIDRCRCWSCTVSTGVTSGSSCRTN